MIIDAAETHLSRGNSAFHAGEYGLAIQYYLEYVTASFDTAELAELIAGNIVLAREYYRRQRVETLRYGEDARVGVCGWELAHNPAGRVLTLAEAYHRVTPSVEIVGAIFPRWGTSLWPPMQGSKIPCHSFIVENEESFFREAVSLVAKHPYDLVHLSKPRFPNFIFGLLYSLIWGAEVIWDVDDEELGFVGAEEPLKLSEALEGKGRLPPPKKLHSSFWTRLTVGQVGRRWQVTVSNPALQQQYGGALLPHVRDETRFTPCASLKSEARRRWSIPENIKVVLFFGTPRKHKGLLETARAVVELQREDVWLVIVGDFPDPSLKQELQSIAGELCRFIPGQPYEAIPEIVALGDYVILLQEADSLVARFQLPAKLVDALAMGLIVFAHVTPAMQWLADAGVVIPVEPGGLSESLSIQLSGDNTISYDEKSRAVFLDQLSIRSCEFLLNNFVLEAKQKQPHWETENVVKLLRGDFGSLML